MEEKEDSNKSKRLSRGRCKIGEPNIHGNRRQNFSKRAEKGDLAVVKKTCPYCHHNKVFGTTSGKFKCCKCKKELKV